VNVLRLLGDFLHIFFAAAWIGAVVQLARLTLKNDNAEALWPMLSGSLRFASNYLLVAATALVVSGLYKLSLILETDAGVFRSFYGQALAAKIFLSVLMFGVAVWNHLVVFRRMAASAADQNWREATRLGRNSSRFMKLMLAVSIIILFLVAALQQL